MSDWTCNRCGRDDVGPGHGATDADPCGVWSVDCDRGRLCLDPAALSAAVGLRVVAGDSGSVAERTARCSGCPTAPAEE